jgi:hypothetical protein
MTALVLVLFFGAVLVWLVFSISTGSVHAVTKLISHISNFYKDFSVRRADQKKQATLQWQKQQIDTHRRTQPVQIVGLPDLSLLHRISNLLDQFIEEVKTYRPQILPYDQRFRSTTFSYPFDFFFPRKNSFGDGPEPETWQVTVDCLSIKSGRPLQSIYNGLSEVSKFPVKAPVIVLELKSRPRLPTVQLPTWSINIVRTSDGRKIDTQSDFAVKAYPPEIKQAEELRQKANELQESIRLKLQSAKEEQERLDLFIAAQKLRVKELTAEFQTCKTRFEQQAAKELEAVREIYKNYLLKTKEGIEGHFRLGLETLPLPLPPEFPWRVFYSVDERLVQVNQRVPFLSDIAVKRPDSNRALAKRDTENFLRRLIPAISMHIARNIAMNDGDNDADTITVNCWSHYFERTTGKLRDAFVSSLKVDKKEIAEMNIDKADALDAFRALKGAFVYSTEEIVPIEPQIRSDKSDKRFVPGKEILEGMAQGQNLANMDWEDFEHLIRELLAKEYGKEGSDVRITRASRDRGVDAVVFDPDPLHGGKYVVQAKRYNNTVDVSAVRDLYGTMLNEGAARGILVTTSRYGRDAYDFASNKPITLIDGQNLLSLLSKHGYQFKIELT